MAAWEKVLAAFIAALKDGRSVTLLNICTIEPYLMKASKYRHPTLGRIQKVPARQYVRMMVARSLKEALRA
jgi:nucleoid DNA-binding protein